LIEVMLAVFVISICLLGVLKLMSTSQRSLTDSLGSLQAQASGEELLQQIRLMRWDQGSVPGVQMSLTGVPLPQVTSAFPPTPRVALEHWSGYTDVDNSRLPFGPFTRSVQVRFVRLNPRNNLVVNHNPQHRKRVTVQVTSRHSTATVTSVFYNLP
jgi:hypothetical protein